MTVAASTKITPPSQPSSQPSSQPCAHLDGESGDANLFFRAMVKAARITRKELAYDLRVSNTLVDCWMNGSKNDPFTQARRAVQPFLDKGRTDLLVPILIYIAGGEQFDSVVLDRIAQLIKAAVRS